MLRDRAALGRLMLDARAPIGALVPKAARPRSDCARRPAPGAPWRRGQVIPGPFGFICPERAGCSARASVIARPRWPGELPPGPPDLRTGNITEATRSMLRGVLGFLPLVLDLAGIFLGLALRCLSLALSLLAQTHDRLLSCPAAPALPHTDRVPQLSCRRRGAPVAPCSTRGEAQTFQISRLSVTVRSPRVRPGLLAAVVMCRTCCPGPGLTISTGRRDCARSPW